MNTIEEITQAIKLSEGTLEGLRTRMEEDYDLWALVPYEAEDAAGKARKGYQSYTSSAPRNFFDKVMDGLLKAVLSIHINLPEKRTEAEKDAANTGELFLFGALAAIDRHLASRGEPPLREALSFLLCLRGWYALRALVYQPKGKGDTAFDVQAWDPLQVTWELGSNGLLWAARKFRATKGQILAEYGLTIRGQEAEVVDFWDTERNSVIIDGASWGKAPTPHNLGHVPILVGAVGSMPSLQGRTADSSLAERGDSVFSAARALFKPYNKYLSNLMDIHERAIVGSLVYETKDGTKTIEGDPYQTFQVILLAEGERLYGLELPKAPPETAAFLSANSQDLQQSTFPFPLAYGGTEQAMSGRALAVLTEATRSVFSPRAEAVARCYTWLSEELLAQFAQKGLKKTEMRGLGGKGGKEFFQVEVKPTQIKPSWSVVVLVEPQLPRDEQGDMQMALAATQTREPGGEPMLSYQTARENILLLKDPTAEDDKIKAERGARLPPIAAAEIAKALKRRGEDEMAEEVMLLLRPQAQQGAAPPALPPQLIEAIVRALVESGQRELAQAFLAALGAGGAPPGAGAPSPERMPPQGMVPTPPAGAPMMPPGMVG